METIKVTMDARLIAKWKMASFVAMLAQPVPVYSLNGTKNSLIGVFFFAHVSRNQWSAPCDSCLDSGMRSRTRRHNSTSNLYISICDSISTTKELENCNFPCGTNFFVLLRHFFPPWIFPHGIFCLFFSLLGVFIYDQNSPEFFCLLRRFTRGFFQPELILFLAVDVQSVAAVTLQLNVAFANRFFLEKAGVGLFSYITTKGMRKFFRRLIFSQMTE